MDTMTQLPLDDFTIAARDTTAEVVPAVEFGTQMRGRVEYVRIETPLGETVLTSDGTHLTGLYLDDFAEVAERIRRHGEAAEVEDNPVLRETERQLGEYFSGRRRNFDLPLAPHGTDFQVGVWRGLTTIPYGRTAGYGELAVRTGRPKAARAVGAANGKNPISIIVPCHRVIGADGSLTGYAWGEGKKRALLDLEAGHAGAH